MADLFAAIKNGCKSLILKTFRISKKDLEATDENGNTVLHLIFQNESLEEERIIQFLKTILKRGINPNVENKNEETPLHIAVTKKMSNAINLLLEFNAETEKSDQEGNFITHHFIASESEKFKKAIESQEDLYVWNENNSAKFVEWLIAKGFDFDRQNDKGFSALHLAIELNMQHILVTLLKHTKHINYVNEENKTLLHLFFEKKCKRREIYVHDEDKINCYHDYTSRYTASIVRILLDRGVSFDVISNDHKTYPNNLLQAAFRYEPEWDILKMLITHRLPQISASDLFTELFSRIGIWSGRFTGYILEILDVLIKDVDVNCVDEYEITAMYYAYIANNLEIVAFLDKHGADFSTITSRGDNLFQALAYWWFPKWDPIDRASTEEKLFDLLVKKDCCDVNRRNNLDETPLFWAAYCENITITRKLVQHGAEVNCANKSCKQMPLHIAAERSQNQDVVKFLLENGAEINAKSAYSRRPLFYAAAHERGNLVALLLEWGAYVNVHSSEASPFLKAISNNFLINVKEMLKYGADINQYAQQIKDELMSESSATRLKNMMVSHWIKLSAADLPYSTEYQDLAQGHTNQKFYESCLREIQTLKKSYIVSRTSFYSFLHMYFDRRRSYIKNQELVDLVNCPDKLQKRFPLYYVLILAAYRETVMWKKLLEPAKRAWLEITDITLPEICIELIFAFLGNNDLVQLIEHNENDLLVQYSK